MERKAQFIFGIHAVREALDAGKEIGKVLVRQGSGSDQFNQLLTELRKWKVPVQRVPVERLNRTTRKNHQGVIAWLSPVTYHDITQLLPTTFESGEDPLLLLLDGISDVRNFGAIARSAEGAGVHAIIIPFSGSAAVTPDAVRTSSGALHRVPVCRHKDLAAVARFLRESGVRLFAATEKSEKEVYRAELTGPVGIIMGSEERGVSGSLLKIADARISLPMKGVLSSLNVSVAAGILLYEVVRQRSLQPK